jgi:arylsulfatase A-like enzyme
MKSSKWIPFALIPLAGVGFVVYARFALATKGVPNVSYTPCVLVAIGLVAAALLVLQSVQPKKPATIGWTRIGRFCLGILVAIVFISLGVRQLEESIFSEIRDHPDRYTLGTGTRNVRISRIPSATSVRLKVPKECVLHSGFGVAEEMFESVPHTLSYTITVSSPGTPPQTLIRKWVEPGSPEGWTDASLNRSSLAESALQITMKIDVDATPPVRGLSLCWYYVKLIFVPGFDFDIRQRVAMWIEPKVMPLRTPEETNVILLGIDALRPDHMSLYGYERETTPYIDRFAGDAARFTNCFTAAPWTLPSFFSMVTSTYPSVHQYGTNFHGEIRQETGTAAIWKIGTISPDYDIKTLAELLRERGYYTAAFVNNPFLSTNNEFDRGFDQYNHYGPTSVEGVEQVLPWLDRHRNEKFFLFFHVMDPHDFSIKDSAIYSLPQRFGNPDDEALEMETNKYDTSLSFCDEQMGELLEGMKWLGLGHHSLVILTSDHGEELHDRGGTGHGHSLNDELLRVPLIMRLPGGLGGEAAFDEHVSTLDIAPTILDILDMPAPQYYQGRSLAPLLAGEELPAKPIFAEALGSGHEKKAVIVGDHKMIYTATANEFELYNLKDDPEESQNLMLRAPEIEREMKQALQPFIEQSRVGFHVALNPPEGLDMCEGIFATNGNFLRVMPLDVTESRIFRANEDAKEILFRLHGEHGTSGFFFEIYPPTAEIRLSLSRNDDPPSIEIFVGAAAENARQAPIEFDRETLRALGTAEMPAMERSGLYVWLKETGREARTVEIDTKTKEKLEALGYLKN